MVFCCRKTQAFRRRWLLCKLQTTLNVLLNFLQTQTIISLACSAQQNSSLNSQLAMQSKQLQELQDSHTATKNELRRAKESLKNSADTKPLLDKISDLEATVKSLEQDSTSLQSEIESLRQWGAPPQRDEEEEENTLAEPEARHAEDIQALRRELEERHREEVDKIKEEHIQEAAVCQSEHEAEVQRLRETLAVVEKEVEELQRKQLEERATVEERVPVEECVVVEEQAPQFMEQPLVGGEESRMLAFGGSDDCCVSFQESVVNGPVENGGNGKVSMEEHEQLVREKEELVEQVKDLEKRLEELKLKNNVRERPPHFGRQHGVRTFSLLQTLRDNCWRARDDAAALEKVCDQKLKQAYREAEVGCYTCVCVCVCTVLSSPFPSSSLLLPATVQGC